MMHDRAMRWTLITLCCVALGACTERRAQPEVTPTYAEVKPVLDAACLKCHSGAQPDGSYAVSSYVATIGCTADGRVVTAPASAGAPLLKVLGRASHRGLLDPSEQELLTRWVRAGAPASRGTVHAAGISDPRSADWHGTVAARDDWAALRDPDATLVCGACHAGSPVSPEGVRFSAPSAPDCRSCHTSSKGVLDCATCHGQDKRAYPPRDPCYFEASAPDAHAAHLGPLSVRSSPLSCATCHDLPGKQLFAAKHANGKVELRFDPALAGVDASYDRTSMQCSVGCHARGGTRAMPAWHETRTETDAGPGKLDCNSCHQSPPPAHYPGSCSSCHAEMGAQEDALMPSKLHLNGKVDLGNGNDTCAACHGEGGDPWPLDRPHQVHRSSKITDEVACTACHDVPGSVSAAGHLDGSSLVSFAGKAVAPGLTPRFDVSTRTCQDVACHVAGLSTAALAPRWVDTLSDPPQCNGCHGVPPAPPHVQLASCGGGLCHGAEVAQSSDGYRITESGRTRHLDGVVQVGE